VCLATSQTLDGTVSIFFFIRAFFAQVIPPVREFNGECEKKGREAPKAQPLCTTATSRRDECASVDNQPNGLATRGRWALRLVKPCVITGVRLRRQSAKRTSTAGSWAPGLAKPFWGIAQPPPRLALCARRGMGLTLLGGRPSHTLYSRGFPDFNFFFGATCAKNGPPATPQFFNKIEAFWGDLSPEMPC